MLSSFFKSGDLGSVPNQASMNSRARMMPVPDNCIPLEREGTAEITNDPRFFTENVIDKRLAAFEALAIVTELMAEEALKQAFELSKDFEFQGTLAVVAVFQLIGFFSVVAVMFASTVACAVLSLQLFFTIRLMTAGPTGFDKASHFYQDKRMWRWRERAILGVKFSMVFMFVASGFLLCAKFYKDALRAGRPHHLEHEVSDIEATEHLIIAGIVLVVFLCCAAYVAWLVYVHQRAFDECYWSVDMCYATEMHGYLLSPTSSPPVTTRPLLAN